ncbi:MAG: RluA family pseudouridine synthase, partial [Fibrobacter sp.]|nr:RluA family pseudouridine synthase [Fibrobacter sp.]
MITRVIDRNFANMRLDRFLRKAFPEESLSVFFAVIRKKKVRVNGVVGKANQMLNEGDTVCIYENFKSVEPDERRETRDERENVIASEAKVPSIAKGFAKVKSTWGKSASSAEKASGWGANELDIVIQTEDYVVINKPSGLASQPGSGTRPGESLVEYLWEWGRREGLDFKPTIAHRLDQETSGMIIAALHGDTLRELTRMIREHEVDKFYFALVKGNLKKDKGTIDETLTRTDAAKGSKMKVGE